MAIRAENQLRAQRIRDMVESKCAEMELNNVPPAYINEVKRMVEHIKQ